jgi:hypothetical protein
MRRRSFQFPFLALLAIAACFLVASAGAASSKASAAKISAHLTKTSFTSSQASSVKLLYKFSAPSKHFSYLLTFKKGSKWQTVKSVKKKGTFKGSKSMTVKKVFSGKPVKVGSYRLKLSADGGSKQLSFKAAPTGSAPANTDLPAISGAAMLSQTLSSSNGSWSHSPSSYAYQWRRCNASGASCSDISSATSSSYALVLADVASTIRLVVTASNSYGSASATSNQTAVVTPENFAFGKTITASTVEGSTLSDQGPADYHAYSANDGNADTYWQSEFVGVSSPQWLEVDLGAATSVGKIVLRLPPATAWTSRTQNIAITGGSTSAPSDTLVAAANYVFDPATQNTVTITFTPTSLRYLRLTFTSNTVQSAAQLSEFEVYAS